MFTLKFHLQCAKSWPLSSEDRDLPTYCVPGWHKLREAGKLLPRKWWENEKMERENGEMERGGEMERERDLLPLQVFSFSPFSLSISSLSRHFLSLFISLFSLRFLMLTPFSLSPFPYFLSIFSFSRHFLSLHFLIFSPFSHSWRESPATCASLVHEIEKTNEQPRGESTWCACHTIPLWGRWRRFIWKTLIFCERLLLPPQLHFLPASVPPWGIGQAWHWYGGLGLPGVLADIPPIYVSTYTTRIPAKHTQIQIQIDVWVWAYSSCWYPAYLCLNI